MTNYSEASAIDDAVKSANHIVVIQADNPDGDSLASALALEQILGDLGKDVTLYCGVDIPSYLSYMRGADRVINQLPHQFDLGIIVDNSSDSLLEQLTKTGAKSWLAARPVIIIDHHTTTQTVGFASIVANHSAVACGEVIYELSQQLDWVINQTAKELLAMAILSDSLGLTAEGVTARSIHIVAELVEGGVKLAELENARRKTMRREEELIHYKGRLLERVEFYLDGRLALVTIPQEELDQYSPLYNPPMLVLDDMRLAKNAALALAFKTYRDGKVTGKIRANYGYGIADKLAEHFGGGGHRYAAGFKIQDGRPYNDIKSESIEVTAKLLNQLDNHEIAQYSN
jgi:phosphoesterase RecJ-like protein